MNPKGSSSRWSAALDRLFLARSVALVGVSADPKKMTGAPVAILKQTGFKGLQFAVNPKYTDIAGVPCYASIDLLPEETDVALITLPAKRVVEAIEACARKGIGCAVVLSSGFEESDSGHDMAKQLARVSHETGVAVVGPNCEGVWSVENDLFLTFGSAAKRNVTHLAPIAILSQSGAIAGSLGRHLQNTGVGCNFLVSVGNETVLSIADYFEWIIERQSIRLVALFIEGLRDGHRLLQLIEKAIDQGIHIVFLKSGNSAQGMQAAASHTGKMASDYLVYQQLLVAAGAIQVDSLGQMIDCLMVLQTCNLPPIKEATVGHGGVGVFSIPGGTRAMTVDYLDSFKVPLATFEKLTVDQLNKALPEFGGTENPTDLTGQVLSQPGLFETCLRIIAQDPNVQALIVQVANRGPQDVLERIALLQSIHNETKMPVIASFLGDVLSTDEQRQLRSAGIICARDPLEASQYLLWLFLARRIQYKKNRGPTSSLATPQFKSFHWDDMIEFLHQCRIQTPRYKIVHSSAEIEETKKTMTFPLVVKALPEYSDHKTENGLVLLHIEKDRLENAVQTIRYSLKRPQAPVLVQEMAKPGPEVLLAAIRNPDFGPILAIGMGGIFTELHQDVVYLALPTNSLRVKNALLKTKLYPILQGYRGNPPADIEALVNCAVHLGHFFATAHASIQELEINPLFINPQSVGGVTAVDMLVRTS